MIWVGPIIWFHYNMNVKVWETNPRNYRLYRNRNSAKILLSICDTKESCFPLFWNRILVSSPYVSSTLVVTRPALIDRSQHVQMYITAINYLPCFWVTFITKLFMPMFISFCESEEHKIKVNQMLGSFELLDDKADSFLKTACGGTLGDICMGAHGDICMGAQQKQQTSLGQVPMCSIHTH